MAYERKMEKDIRCPLEYGMALFGGKWKSRILCVLALQRIAHPLHIGAARAVDYPAFFPSRFDQLPQRGQLILRTLHVKV